MLNFYYKSIFDLIELSMFQISSDSIFPIKYLKSFLKFKVWISNSLIKSIDLNFKSIERVIPVKTILNFI